MRLHIELFEIAVFTVGFTACASGPEGVPMNTDWATASDHEWALLAAAGSADQRAALSSATFDGGPASHGHGALVQPIAGSAFPLVTDGAVDLGVEAVNTEPSFRSNSSAESEYFAIHSDLNGRCLDVHVQDANKNGVRVQMWDCNGQPQQQWEVSFEGVDTDGEYLFTLHSGLNNKCLDADANGIEFDGTKVQLWDCNDSDQQRWRIVETYGFLRVQNRRARIIDPGLGFLDADLNTDHNGGIVQLWTYRDQPNQQWY